MAGGLNRTVANLLHFFMFTRSEALWGMALVGDWETLVCNVTYYLRFTVHVQLDRLGLTDKCLRARGIYFIAMLWTRSTVGMSS